MPLFNFIQFSLNVFTLLNIIMYFILVCSFSKSLSNFMLYGKTIWIGLVILYILLLNSCIVIYVYSGNAMVEGGGERVVSPKLDCTLSNDKEIGWRHYFIMFCVNTTKLRFN